MKHVDRVICAFNHEEPDILPYSEEFTSIESQDKFLGYKLGSADWKEQMLAMYRFLDSDIVDMGAPLTPDFLNEKVIKTDTHWIVRTLFGSLVYFKRKPGRAWQKVIHTPIKHPEDLDRLEQPSPNRSETEIAEISKAAKWFADKEYFVDLLYKGAIAGTWYYLRGFEKFMADLVMNPPFAKRLIEFNQKAQIEIIKAIIEQTPADSVHSVRVCDDMGVTDTCLISPKKYRELVRPWHEKAIKTFHKMGLFVALHTDGNINAILDDIVSVGFDCLDPLAPHDHIDLAEVKEKYGYQITLRGGLSRYVGMMSQNELKQHIIDRVQIGAPGGGFILYNGSGIPPEMTFKKLNYYKEVVKKVRRQPYAKLFCAIR